ncbi:MAG: MFS transporter [Acidobacteriota bacterium]|nr:MFS transporter [Acidobacteriota bacterium]
MAVSYFLYFAFFGVIVPFLSPALLELGYTKQETGMIVAGLYFINTIMPIVGGRVSDKFLTIDQTIRIGALGMAVFSTLIWWQSSTASVRFLLLLFLMGICRGVMIPMLDALAMHVGGNDAKRFSRVRMAGSIGFVVMVAAMGYLIEAFGIRVFFPTMVGVCLVYLLGTLTILPKEGEHQEASRHPHFWRTLNGSWWVWLFALVCHWVAFSPYHYGFTLFQEEIGIQPQWWGWLWNIGVAAEIFVFLCAGWFFARMSFKTVLLVAFVSSLVRWTLMAVYPVPWVLAVTQLLHGPGFALFYAAALQGITHYCGGVNRASYQGLFSTAVGGFAAVAGSAAAGWLHQRMPFHQVLFWFVPVQILGILVLLINRLQPIGVKETTT